MPGSGAGSNLYSAILLSNVGPNVTPITHDDALTGYGVQGQNDSWGTAFDARAFKAFQFSIVAAPGSDALDGYTVEILNTIDPNAWQTWYYAIQGRTPQGQSALPFGGSPSAVADAAAGFRPGIPASSWALMSGLQDQTGAGMSANPMTTAVTLFNANGPIIAVRAIVTAVGDTPAGTFNVVMLGIP